MYCSWTLQKILLLSLLSLTVPEFQIDCFTEFTAAANREDLSVRGKSTECLMEHCQSATPDFWVLTYIFRPTKKTLFIYVRISIVVVCTISPMYTGLTKLSVRPRWLDIGIVLFWHVYGPRRPNKNFLYGKT